MIAGLGLGSDARRYFHFTLPRLAVLTIILMPLLYGGLYLYTFWNPFGEVDKIPVAIVNLDKGTTLAGEQLDAGAQVTNQLIESGQLNLTKVRSAEEGMDELLSGKYYFLIVIPEDFSEAIASPITGNPRKAELKFYFNDANSYLSTVIGQDASQQIINQVNEAISKQSLGEVLVAVAESAPVLDTVDGGAGELARGLGEAKDAAANLAAGAQVLTGPLATAAADTAALAQRANELVGRIDAVSTQLQQIVGRNPVPQQVATINGDVSRVLGNASAELRQIDLPLAQRIADDLAGAQARLNEASALLAGWVNTGDASVISAIGEVKAVADSLNGAVQKLNADMGAVVTGGQDVATGVEGFAAILEELSAGAEKLATGFESILHNVPKWTQEQRDGVASALTTPVLLKEDVLNEAPNFGTGFAPFFMSLALYVGALLIWMLLTPLRSRPLEAGVGLFRTVWISYWPAMVAGVLQALVLYGVVILIGLRPTYVVGMGLFAILVSLTFLALIQMFNAVFGKAVGRVVSMALLMLQLVSSGGIYPVQTTAGPIQGLNSIDPMTYTVNGYRQLSVGDPMDSRVWVAVAVLVSIGVVSFCISALCARRNRIYTMGRLYPMVDV